MHSQRPKIDTFLNAAILRKKCQRNLVWKSRLKWLFLPQNSNMNFGGRKSRFWAQNRPLLGSKSTPFGGKNRPLRSKTNPLGGQICSCRVDSNSPNRFFPDSSMNLRPNLLFFHNQRQIFYFFHYQRQIFTKIEIFFPIFAFFRSIREK